MLVILCLRLSVSSMFSSEMEDQEAMTLVKAAHGRGTETLLG